MVLDTPGFWDEKAISLWMRGIPAEATTPSSTTEETPPVAVRMGIPVAPIPTFNSPTLMPPFSPVINARSSFRTPIPLDRRDGSFTPGAEHAPAGNTPQAFYEPETAPDAPAKLPDKVQERYVGPLAGQPATNGTWWVPLAEIPPHCHKTHPDAPVNRHLWTTGVQWRLIDRGLDADLHMTSVVFT